MRIVVGDIHGCYKSFRYLLEEKIGISRSDDVYLLGDYIDRGPSSKQVIDFIMRLKTEGYKIYPLMGNHEEMLINAYTHPHSNNYMLWMMNGGETTFQSYQIDSYLEMDEAAMNDLPEDHISFMRRLPYYYELEDYILVHAGINFMADEPFQDIQSMVWCRDCENDLFRSGGRIVVHGHTPIPVEEIEVKSRERHLSQINLDAGCVYKGRMGMGTLAAMDLDTRKIYRTENLDI